MAAITPSTLHQICSFEHVKPPAVASELPPQSFNCRSEVPPSRDRSVPRLLLPSLRILFQQYQADPTAVDADGWTPLERLLQQDLLFQDQAACIEFLLDKTFPVVHPLGPISRTNPLRFLSEYPYQVNNRLALTNLFAQHALETADVKTLTLALVAFASTPTLSTIITHPIQHTESPPPQNLSTAPAASTVPFDSPTQQQLQPHPFDTIPERFDIIKYLINAIATIHLSKQPSAPLNAVPMVSTFTSGMPSSREIDTTTLFPVTFYNALILVTQRTLLNTAQSRLCRISIALYLIRTLFQFFPTRVASIPYQPNHPLRLAIDSAPLLTLLDREVLLAPLRQYQYTEREYLPWEGTTVFDTSNDHPAQITLTPKQVRQSLTLFKSEILDLIKDKVLDEVLQAHFDDRDLQTQAQTQTQTPAQQQRQRKHVEIIERLRSKLIPSSTFLFALLKLPGLARLSVRIPAPPTQTGLCSSQPIGSLSGSPAMITIRPWPVFLMKLYLSRTETWILDLSIFSKIMSGFSTDIGTRPIIDQKQVMEVLSILRFQLEYQSVTARRLAPFGDDSNTVGGVGALHGLIDLDHATPQDPGPLDLYGQMGSDGLMFGPQCTDSRKIGTRSIQMVAGTTPSLVCPWASKNVMDNVRAGLGAGRFGIDQNGIPKRSIRQARIDSVKTRDTKSWIGGSTTQVTTATQSQSHVGATGQLPDLLSPLVGPTGGDATPPPSPQGSPLSSGRASQSDQIDPRNNMSLSRRAQTIQYFLALKQALPVSLYDIRVIQSNPSQFSPGAAQQQVAKTLSKLPGLTVGGGSAKMIALDTSSGATASEAAMPKSTSTFVSISPPASAHRINLSPGVVTYPVTLPLLHRFGRALPPELHTSSRRNKVKQPSTTALDSDSDDDDDDLYDFEQFNTPDHGNLPFPLFQHPMPSFFDHYRALYSFILSVYLPFPMDVGALTVANISPLKHPVIHLNEQLNAKRMDRSHTISPHGQSSETIPVETTVSSPGPPSTSTPAAAPAHPCLPLFPSTGTLTFPQLLPKILMPHILGHEAILTQHLIQVYETGQDLGHDPTSNNNLTNTNNQNQINAQLDRGLLAWLINMIPTVPLSVSLPLYSLMYFNSTLDFDTITALSTSTLSLYRLYHQHSANVLNSRETWLSTITNATALVTPYQFSFLRPTPPALRDILAQYCLHPDLNYPISSKISFRGVRTPLLQAILYSGMPLFPRQPTHRRLKSDPFNYKTPSRWDFHYMFVQDGDFDPTEVDGAELPDVVRRWEENWQEHRRRAQAQTQQQYAVALAAEMHSVDSSDNNSHLDDPKGQGGDHEHDLAEPLSAALPLTIQPLPAWSRNPHNVPPTPILDEYLDRFLAQPRHVVNPDAVDPDGLTLLSRLILNPGSLGPLVRQRMIEKLLRLGKASPFVYGRQGVPLIHSLIAFPTLRRLIPLLFKQHPTLALLYNNHGLLPIHLVCSLINAPFSPAAISAILHCTPLDPILTTFRPVAQHNDPGRPKGFGWFGKRTPAEYHNPALIRAFGKNNLFSNVFGGSIAPAVNSPASGAAYMAQTHLAQAPDVDVFEEGYLVPGSGLRGPVSASGLYSHLLQQHDHAYSSRPDLNQLKPQSAVGFEGISVLHMMLGSNRHQFAEYNRYCAKKKFKTNRTKAQAAKRKLRRLLSREQRTSKIGKNPNQGFLLNGPGSQKSFQLTENLATIAVKPLGHYDPIFGRLNRYQAARLALINGQSSTPEHSPTIEFWDEHIANGLATLMDGIVDKMWTQQQLDAPASPLTPSVVHNPNLDLF